MARPERPRVWAPSDLVRGRRAVPSTNLGGRVIDTGSPNSLLLADAFAQIRVTTRARHRASAGDLLVVRGRWSRGQLSDARVVQRQPGPIPKGDGEFARFAWQGVAANLSARARVLEGIRAYFRGERFLEVDTPVRVRTPGLDSNVDALVADGGYLNTSPEFHMKRLLVGGMPRIFQITHCFRADESGSLHEPEFTMLEWYRAFADTAEVMRDTERIVALTASIVRQTPSFEVSGRRILVEPPFPRLSIQAAFRRYVDEPDALTLAERDEDRFFRLLVEQVEPALARRSKPVFLTDYPSSQAALARRRLEPPHTAERFELYLGGVELCNGYRELTDPEEQRARFDAERRTRAQRGAPDYALDEPFLSGLVEGMPPAAGNALGLDRLVMLALGAESLEQVIAFPDRNR